MKFRHVLAGAVALACATVANANTIKVTLNPLLTNVATGTFYYDIAFQGGLGTVGSPSSRLQTGDFFTIYDFAGYTGVHGNSLQLIDDPSTVAIDPIAANWVLTATNATGPNAIGTAPPDSAGLVNLTWTYTGPTLTTPPNVTFLPVFATSSYAGNVTLGWYTSQDELDTTLAGFQDSGNIDRVEVPAVPSPAAAMGGMALLGVLGGSQVLRRRSMK